MSILKRGRCFPIRRRRGDADPVIFECVALYAVMVPLVVGMLLLIGDPARMAWAGISKPPPAVEPR